MAKTLDVFVSYRRSNGSQLASLLKVSTVLIKLQKQFRFHLKIMKFFNILILILKLCYCIPFLGASSAAWFLSVYRCGAPGGGQI